MAAMSNRPDASARWQLEPSVILDSNQKNCRIWKCGGLLRRTRWQDIPGFGGDEDADIDNEETAIS